MDYNLNMGWNLAQRLQDSVPAHEWQLLQRIAETASELDLPLYVVGGVPRDVLLGLPANDFDLVVEGRADILARVLASRYGGKVTVHGKFGTAKWDLETSNVPAPVLPIESNGLTRRMLDLVSARAETYKHPAALPTVTPGTIGDDLRRRDFSINAIAIRLDGEHLGEVRDDVGGAGDLDQRLVRVLHARSFMDDPTRLYRAVRYEQRYGFSIADETLELMSAAREFIQSLSAQRIRHELDLMLEETRVANMLRRLDELDLLKPIDRALFYDEGVAVRLGATEEPLSLASIEPPRQELGWLLWLMVLPVHQVETLNRRLQFGAPLLKELLAASTLSEDLEPSTGYVPSWWTERLDRAPLAAVYAVCVALPHGIARAAVEHYLSEWRHVKPGTTGHDLKRLGVKPGAEYQRILRELRRAWLDGEIDSPQAEREYLRTLLSHGSST